MEGWSCPKCGQVYAPWVNKCSNCTSKQSYTTTWSYPTCSFCGAVKFPGTIHNCTNTITCGNSSYTNLTLW